MIPSSFQTLEVTVCSFFFCVFVAGKRSNSAKVFSALSRSWSSRSLQFTPDAVSSYEPCRPGAHSITLEKLYAAEQKLYKDIKVLLL